MSDDRLIDGYGTPDTFAEQLAKIERRGGMVFLTFVNLRDGERQVVARLLMTEQVYEVMRTQLRGDGPVRHFPLDVAAECIGTA